MPINTAFRRLRQEDLEFKASQSYRARPSQKQKRYKLFNDKPANTHIFSGQFDTCGVMLCNLCVCKLRDGSRHINTPT
jgi:hypothetical protein